MPYKQAGNKVYVKKGGKLTRSTYEE